VLCSLLWVTLLGQGVGLGDPQRTLPTPAILRFCDSVPRGSTQGSVAPLVAFAEVPRQELCTRGGRGILRLRR